MTCRSPARHHQLQRHHATCHHWCQHLGYRVRAKDLLQSSNSSVTCRSPARHRQLQRHHATYHHWCQHLGCRVRVKDLLQSSTSATCRSLDPASPTSTAPVSGPTISGGPNWARLQQLHATCHHWCQHLGCRVRVKDLSQSSSSVTCCSPDPASPASTAPGGAPITSAPDPSGTCLHLLGDKSAR